MKIHHPSYPIPQIQVVSPSVYFGTDPKVAPRQKQAWLVSRTKILPTSHLCLCGNYNLCRGAEVRQNIESVRYWHFFLLFYLAAKAFEMTAIDGCTNFQKTRKMRLDHLPLHLAQPAAPSTQTSYAAIPTLWHPDLTNTDARTGFKAYPKRGNC